MLDRFRYLLPKTSPAYAVPRASDQIEALVHRILIAITNYYYTGKILRLSSTKVQQLSN